jgi:hypothetical protein
MGKDCDPSSLIENRVENYLVPLCWDPLRHSGFARVPFSHFHVARNAAKISNAAALDDQLIPSAAVSPPS